MVSCGRLGAPSGPGPPLATGTATTPVVYRRKRRVANPPQDAILPHIGALLALLFALLLAGCAVGPNYKRPAVAVPDQYRSAAADAASLADKKWSDLFQDDALRQLVATALEHNFDLGIASERVLEARAQFAYQRADEFPNVSAQAGFTAARASGASSLEALPPGTRLQGSYWQAGLALSWELDLWGRLRRLSESARAQYLATEEGRRGVVVSLIGDVMSDYFLLRERDLELEIASRTRDIAQDNLRLVELRHTRGAVTGLDVHQAEQFLYTATAQMASARRDIAQTENALSLLAGKAPGEIARGKALAELETPAQVPPGLPSSLLERRPDIRQAEQTLIAANARIGAAKALYFPQIYADRLSRRPEHRAGEFVRRPGAAAGDCARGRLASLQRGADSRRRALFGSAEARDGDRLSEDHLHRAARSLRRAGGLHRNARAAHPAGAAGGRASGEHAPVEPALQGGTRQLSASARFGAQSVPGRARLAQLRLAEMQSFVQLYRALGGGWQ
jgi:outer membrane protein TolC